jgi:hypothetical protein
MFVNYLVGSLPAASAADHKEKMPSGATWLDQGKKIALTEIKARRESLET